MRKLILSSVVTAAVALAGPAAAQQAGSRQTREFVQAAGQSDQFEMLESRMALTQSGDPQIRTFAQRLIDDHGQTSRTLQQAAASAGLEPPPMGLSDDQARLVSELQSVSGSRFDQAYWRHQALAHRSALTVHQGYAAKGDNPAVRQAAAAAVGMISTHLATAEQMNAKQPPPADR